MIDHEEIWEAFVAGVDVEAALAERPGGRLDRIVRNEHTERVIEHRMHTHQVRTRPNLTTVTQEASEWLARRRQIEQQIAAYAANKRKRAS